MFRSDLNARVLPQMSPPLYGGRHTAVATLTARCRNGKNYVQSTHNCANCAQLRTLVDFIVLSIKIVLTVLGVSYSRVIYNNNSMILYLTHIIHIDDFPVNGYPTSLFLIIINNFQTCFAVFSLESRIAGAAVPTHRVYACASILAWVAFAFVDIYNIKTYYNSSKMSNWVRRLRLLTIHL